MSAANDETPLQIPTPAQIRTELALREPTGVQIHPGEDTDLDSKADHYVQLLTSLDPRDLAALDTGKAAVETMAADLQKQAVSQMGMLNQPIKALAGRGTEGGDVANALIDLKMKVEELDPGKFDFEPGWLSRTLGRLPGVGTPIKRYFSKYESAQTVIAAIVRSLEMGRDQLMRDNITLGEDQKQMRGVALKLEQSVKLGQLIDQKLQYKLDRELQANPDLSKFVAEELMFPLRQRIIDLQQQLAVHQQGVLATELIIRNNKELARGVNRALSVTVTALKVAATVAMALANQKIVLDKIAAVSQMTSDLIAGTAARLKTQGVQIQAQAASAQLDLNSLRSAFADINAAFEDLSKFRQNALPQMASTVLELDQITHKAEQSIQQMERAKHSQGEIKIDAF